MFRTLASRRQLLPAISITFVLARASATSSLLKPAPKMKRARDESNMEDCDMEAVGMTPPPSYLWASMSPWKPSHASAKRCRDRSVPVDALSRMMSAAITNARIKKHSSIGRLFATKNEAPRACCSVCESTERQFSAGQMQRCSHCERQMGDCCRRECDACCNVFCSLCSTLNCDEQFDRVFCLSCNEEQQGSG